jgi:pimeloyl-ACP methyl ester carboxylesterase
MRSSARAVPILALTVLPVLAACGPATQHGTTKLWSYDVAGKGPVVVLIGDSAGPGVWEKQFPVLAKSFEVVNYAPVPGAGADVLNEMLDHLVVTKASLIALGTGATTAIDFTLAHPDRVESLVLVSPHLANAHGALVDIKAPLLLIVGTKGDSQAVLGVDTLRAHLGGVQTITMPGVGHQVNVERAKSFNSVVQEFLFHIHPEAAPRQS